MSKQKNKKMYNKVKEEAKKKFKRFPSLYASAWIQKEYKKQGGKYSGKKPNKTNVGKWFKEEWIQVIPYVKDNKKIVCGDKNKMNKACRPLKKIDSKTPLTIKEIVKLHGKKKVIELANKKNKDMDGRLLWKSGTFKNSK
mgnify:FL=1